MQRVLWILAGLGLTSGLWAADVKYNRDIRPILATHCLTCHGPDATARQGELRLDLREAAIEKQAIVPGQIDASNVIERITSTDPDLVMPPPDFKKPLSADQQTLLKQWIAEGAEYQGHWAFQRVERPNVPAVAGVDHPVDRFIRERLTREGLAHNVPAAKETLIRRVTLDLTGLPPTLEEIDAFLADDSPQAFEKVVDRLLASPHYGERQAQQWLDFARYADSNGFQVDSSRQMWAWRDWVIGAFNRNQPFDQFTVEQLAGDMLPEPTREQIIATGFNRNMRLNGEGGRIAEEWFAETVIDRVETIGLTWMGLTLNCCRCHDHKYDPISQKEFYQLFAFFNSVEESGVLDSEGGNRGGGNSRPVLPLTTPEHEAELAKLKAAIEAAETDLAAAKQSLGDRQAAWEQEFSRQLQEQGPIWQALNSPQVISAGGATFGRQEDGSWLASGENPANDVYTITSPLVAGQFSGLLLEAFPDPSLPNQSLGRYSNGNFVLTGVEATISVPSLAAPIEATVQRAVADYEQPGWPIQAILDGPGKGKRNTKGWAVDGPTKREPRKAVFAFAAPVDVPPDATVTITLRHDAIGGHNIGRFRLSTSSYPPASLSLDGTNIPEDVRTALTLPTEQRTKLQQEALTKYFREQADGVTKQAQQQVASAKKSLEDYTDTIPTVMVMQERAQPREAHILVRGQYDRPGDVVPRGLPDVFPPLPEGAPLNRLGFAQWLTSREHPLTSRVWVNRAWERFFGAGLVRTTENLGAQAEWPSHLELLDWLSAEFMEPSTLPAVNGVPAAPWDIKALDKFLVMSATYQQSAQVTHDKDPDNRLLSRGPRFRLSAETTRDQALAVSGLLVPKVGGPSVRPYMPDGVWDETSRYGDLRGYKPDSGAGLYRRSLYTIWKRTAAPPSMMLFDAPSREVCTIKRSRTNTPLQALALLNEITFVEASRKLGERMLSGGATPEERLRYGFRLVTSRQPTEAELQVLVSGISADTAYYREQPQAAQQLSGVGTSPPPANMDPAEYAAYTLAANVLLNLDEVVTRE